MNPDKGKIVTRIIALLVLQCFFISVIPANGSVIPASRLRDPANAGKAGIQACPTLRQIRPIETQQPTEASGSLRLTAEEQVIENDLKGIFGDDDLVASLRLPEEEQEEAQKTVKNALRTLAVLAKKEDAFEDEAKRREFLMRKVPYGIYIGAGLGTRTIEEALRLKQVFPMGGGHSPVTTFRDAMRSWRFAPDRPTVAAVDYITAYHLLQEGAVISTQVRKKLNARIKREWEGLLNTAGFSEKERAELEEAGITPKGIATRVNRHLRFAADSRQKEDSAAFMRNLDKAIKVGVKDKFKGFRLYQDIGLMVFQPMIEASNWGEPNPYVDPQKVKNVLGENVLVAVAAPYGTLAAYEAGYERLKGQWKAGALAESDYCGACYADSPAASYMTKYSDFNRLMWFKGFDLENPETDPENVIITASKGPLDTTERKGHVLTPDTSQEEFANYSNRVQIMLEWKELSDAQQAKSREQFERGEYVPLNAAFTFLFNNDWIEQANVFARIHEEHLEEAKGKEETWFLKALDIRAKELYVEETTGNPDAPTRVVIIALPEPVTSGVKNKERIDKYRQERYAMMEEILGGIEGIEIATGANVTIVEPPGFKLERDLAKIFEGTADSPVRLAGEVVLEVNSDTRIAAGTNLDGSQMPLALNCVNRAVSGAHNGLTALDLTPEDIDIYFGPEPEDARVLSEVEKETFLGKRGIIVSPGTRVVLYGGVDEVNIGRTTDYIFGSFVDGKKVVEQIYLDGEEVRLHATSRVENGACLRDFDLGARSTAGRMTMLAHGKVTNTTFAGRPDMDSWSYQLPYQRQWDHVGIEAEGKTFFYSDETRKTGLTKQGKSEHFLVLAKLLNETGLVRFTGQERPEELDAKIDGFFDPVPENIARARGAGRIFMPGYMPGGYRQGQLLGLPDWDNTTAWRIDSVCLNALEEFARKKALEEIGDMATSKEIGDFCKRYVKQYGNEVQEAVECLLHARLADETYWQAGKTANQLNSAVRGVVRAALVKYGELGVDEDFNPYEVTNRQANSVALASIEEGLTLKEYCQLAIAAGFVDFDNPELRQQLDEAREQGRDFLQEMFAKNKERGLEIDEWGLYEQRVVETQEPLLNIVQLDNNGEAAMDAKNKLEQLLHNPNLVVVFVGKDGQYSNDVSWRDIEEFLVDDMLNWINGQGEPKLGELWPMMLREQVDEMLDRAVERAQINEGQRDRIERYVEGKRVPGQQARFFNFTAGPRVQGVDGEKLSATHARLLSAGKTRATTRSSVIELATGKRPSALQSDNRDLSDLDLFIQATGNKLLETKGQANIEMVDGLNELDCFHLAMVKGMSTRTVSGLNDATSPMVLYYTPAGTRCFEDYADTGTRRSDELVAAYDYLGLDKEKFMFDAEGKPFGIAGKTLVESITERLQAHDAASRSAKAGGEPDPAAPTPPGPPGPRGPVGLSAAARKDGVDITEAPRIGSMRLDLTDDCTLHVDLPADMQGVAGEIPQLLAPTLNRIRKLLPRVTEDELLIPIEIIIVEGADRLCHLIGTEEGTYQLFIDIDLFRDPADHYRMDPDDLTQFSALRPEALADAEFWHDINHWLLESVVHKYEEELDPRRQGEVDESRGGMSDVLFDATDAYFRGDAEISGLDRWEYFDELNELDAVYAEVFAIRRKIREIKDPAQRIETIYALIDPYLPGTKGKGKAVRNVTNVPDLERLVLLSFTLEDAMDVEEQIERFTRQKAEGLSLKIELEPAMFLMHKTLSSLREGDLLEAMLDYVEHNYEETSSFRMRKLRKAKKVDLALELAHMKCFKQAVRTWRMTGAVGAEASMDDEDDGVNSATYAIDFNASGLNEKNPTLPSYDAVDRWMKKKPFPLVGMAGGHGGAMYFESALSGAYGRPIRVIVVTDGVDNGGSQWKEVSEGIGTTELGPIHRPAGQHQPLIVLKPKETQNFFNEELKSGKTYESSIREYIEESYGREMMKEEGNYYPNLLRHLIDLARFADRELVPKGYLQQWGRIQNRFQEIIQVVTNAYSDQRREVDVDQYVVGQVALSFALGFEREGFVVMPFSLDFEGYPQHIRVYYKSGSRHQSVHSDMPHLTKGKGPEGRSLDGQVAITVIDAAEEGGVGKYVLTNADRQVIPYEKLPKMPECTVKAMESAEVIGVGSGTLYSSVGQFMQLPNAAKALVEHSTVVFFNALQPQRETKGALLNEQAKVLIDTLRRNSRKTELNIGDIFKAWVVINADDPDIDPDLQKQLVRTVGDKRRGKLEVTQREREFFEDRGVVFEYSHEFGGARKIFGKGRTLDTSTDEITATYKPEEVAKLLMKHAPNLSLSEEEAARVQAEINALDEACVIGISTGEAVGSVEVVASP